MANGKTLCLNMIVKNEMANLDRCLRAVADHISCWVIADTGSTDGTQDFIQSFFAERGIPGELHSFPFINFEQARNAALDHAAASRLAYDYLLLTDADMELVVEDPQFREKLEGPCYDLLQRTGLSYWNARIVRRDAGARYRGVTHEYLEVPGGGKQLSGVWFDDHATGGSRGDKFERDIRLLTQALEAEPENHRYWFYLAQSYRDSGRKTEAVTAYDKRISLGGWEEEAWYARLQKARCLKDIEDEAGFVREALGAFNQRPHRAEPLYELARHYRNKGMNDASVLYSEPGLAVKRPDNDILFVEDYVYQYGMREEYSIAANYSRDPARKDRGFAACNWLALNRGVPADPRRLARHNLRFYVEPASAMMPSYVAHSVGFTPPDGYHLTNPSVARLGVQIVMVQRTVNYIITGDNQYETPNGAPVHTRNFLLRLDPALQIQSSAEILPPADLPKPSFDSVQGFEDMRLFAWRGELWCSSAVRELTEEGWCEQVLARIDQRAAGDARLTDWRVLRPEVPRQHEKNWMPLVDNDRLQFIYLCDPTRILDEQARKVIESSPAITCEQFRGGSQAIDFDGGHLILVHEALNANGKERVYHHRFVWLDTAGVLRGVSRPFFFQQHGVEFAAGLAWHPDGKRLMISFGVQDRESWIATVDASDVQRALGGEEGLFPATTARPAASKIEFGGDAQTPESALRNNKETHCGRESVRVANPGATPWSVASEPAATSTPNADRKPRILFYCEDKWALGAIHQSLLTHLRAAGWDAIIRDWSKRQLFSEFADLVAQYDYVVTLPFGGTKPLVHSYRIPREKIILVAHAEWDLQKLIAAEGVDEFDRYAGYALVSDSLVCSSLALGIKRVPFVVRLGVDFPKYRRDVSASLSSVGYAAIMSRLTVSGIEQKRGSLARACAEAAGLRFAPVKDLPFEKMPEFYASVDAVIMPSLQEGAGLPPLEAAAAGRLVIGTPVGHFPRLAYEGLGILAPLEAGAFQRFTTDALIYYRNNPSAYVEKCNAIQEAAKQRDWRYTVNDWIELFSEAGRRTATHAAPKQRSYEEHLEELTVNQKGVFFIEVGANDGKSFDPLYDFAIKNNWSGLLIEPHPQLVERLRENYRSCKNVKFENVAISDKIETRELHCVSLEAVDGGKVPDWAKGISSLYNDRNALGGKRVASEAYLSIKNHLTTIEVPCVPLMSLLEKHSIENVDVIQIDTEGHDYHVLRQIDFARLQPKLVYFESCNLPPDELKSATQLLEQNGYCCIDYKFNILAIRSATRAPSVDRASEG